MVCCSGWKGDPETRTSPHPPPHPPAPSALQLEWLLRNADREDVDFAAAASSSCPPELTDGGMGSGVWAGGGAGGCEPDPAVAVLKPSSAYFDDIRTGCLLAGSPAFDKLLAIAFGAKWKAALQAREFLEGEVGGDAAAAGDDGAPTTHANVGIDGNDPSGGSSLRSARVLALRRKFNLPLTRALLPAGSLTEFLTRTLEEAKNSTDPNWRAGDPFVPQGTVVLHFAAPRAWEVSSHDYMREAAERQWEIENYEERRRRRVEQIRRGEQLREERQGKPGPRVGKAGVTAWKRCTGRHEDGEGKGGGALNS